MGGVYAFREFLYLLFINIGAVLNSWWQFWCRKNSNLNLVGSVLMMEGNGVDS